MQPNSQFLSKVKTKLSRYGFVIALKIFDHNGIEIINWPISAYGKTSTTTFSDDNDLANAAILAMRDAAALIILQLEKTNKLALSAKQT